MIQMLVQAGVDPNIRAGTFTPLHRAAECNTETVMRALLDAGADPTAANEAGATPPGNRERIDEDSVSTQQHILAMARTGVL